MAAWDYDSTGSSLVAPSLLQAAMNEVIRLGKAENESNQEGGTQTAFVSYQVTGDNEKVFAATLALPGRLVRDAVNNKVRLQPRVILAEFLTDYVAGTGTLADEAHDSAAIIKLAEDLTYWERQVQSTIVTKTPNQTILVEDIEGSQYNIQFNIPARFVTDVATGKIELEAVDFLYILASQV